MSIADRFEKASDDAFIRAYDPQSARQQFWTSFVLIVFLAATAFVLGVFVRSEISRPPQEQTLPIRIETPKKDQHKIGNAAVAQLRSLRPMSSLLG
jgi:hypothetical protein